MFKLEGLHLLESTFCHYNVDFDSLEDLEIYFAALFKGRLDRSQTLVAKTDEVFQFEGSMHPAGTYSIHFNGETVEEVNLMEGR